MTGELAAADRLYRALLRAPGPVHPESAECTALLSAIEDVSTGLDALGAAGWLRHQLRERATVRLHQVLATGRPAAADGSLAGQITAAVAADDPRALAELAAHAVAEEPAGDEQARPGA